MYLAELFQIDLADDTLNYFEKNLRISASCSQKLLKALPTIIVPHLYVLCLNLIRLF